MDNAPKSPFFHNYMSMCREQSVLYGKGDRLPQGYHRDIATRIFLVISEAIRRTRGESEGEGLQVCTAATGSGKSSYARCVAAAAQRTDPEFTCAFVLPTVPLVAELYAELLPLLANTDRASVAIWTSAHQRGAAKERRAEHDLEFPKEWEFTKEEFKEAKIVVCTHKLWETEVCPTNGKPADNGVLRRHGKYRDVVVIDESPELAGIYERTPIEVARLAELLAGREGSSEWADAVYRVEDRMRRTFQREGAQFQAGRTAEPLVKREDLEVLNEAVFNRLCSVGTPLDPAVRGHCRDTLAFLEACNKGFVFFTRPTPSCTDQTRKFIAYRHKFADHPPQVLLDATADLANQAGHLSGVEFTSPPAPDYSGLKWHHMFPPDSYRTHTEHLNKRPLAESYAQWIRERVLEHTKPGDTVLIVVRLALVETHGLFEHVSSLEAASDEDRVDAWDKRKVMVLTYGRGIGSSLYKEAEHVFLFGEFIKPKNVYIATSCALTETPAAEADLSRYSGSALSGIPLSLREGDSLLQLKQMAARGSCRVIGEDGKCAPMNLYTTGNFNLWMRHIEEVFPGVTPPTVEHLGDAEDYDRANRLIELLTREPSRIPKAALCMSTEEVADYLGIPRSSVAIVLGHRDVKPIVQVYGWERVSAHEIGKQGTRKFLVHPSILPDLRQREIEAPLPFGEDTERTYSLPAEPGDKPADKLKSLLRELTVGQPNVSYMSSAEVAKHTGLEASSLRRTLNGKRFQRYMEELGTVWTTCPASVLGEPGRQHYLVRTSYLESLDAQDGRDAA